MLVCNKCGSTRVQATAWVDANTNEYINDYDESYWCNNCEEECKLKVVPDSKKPKRSKSKLKS